jgi:DNA invertase Pin-like site-specific DNA recombinase
VPREKPYYRETLERLKSDGFKECATKTETAKRLGISRPTLDKWIRKGLISCVGGKISRESVARYKCM